MSVYEILRGALEDAISVLEGHSCDLYYIASTEEEIKELAERLRTALSAVPDTSAAEEKK